MTHCQNCQSGGAGHCASLWTLDFAILSGLRRAQDQVRAHNQSQIAIADLLRALCADAALTDHFQQFGVETAELARALQAASGQRRAAVRNSGGRVVLSQALNALFVACEEGARIQGRSTVSVETLFATLVQNAEADPDAALFAKYATRIRRTSRSISHHVGTHREPASHRIGAGHTVGTRVHDDVAPRTPQDGTARLTGRNERSRWRQYGSRGVDASGYQSSSRNALRFDGPASRDGTQRRDERAERHPGLSHDSAARYAQLEKMVREQERRLAQLESKKQKRSQGFKLRRIQKLSKSGGSSTDRHRARSHAGSDQNSDRTREDDTRRQTWDRRHGTDAQSGDRHASGDRTWSQDNRQRDQDRTGRGDRADRNRHDHNHDDSRSSRSRNSETSQRDAGAARSSRQFTSEHRYGSHDEARTVRRSSDRYRDREDRRDGHDFARTASRRDERTSRRSAADTTEAKEKKFYLSLDDDVVDAPSIGPKTAARLKPIGVRSVRDLLALDVADAAAQLKVRHITAEVLRDWQDQARLVCTVPWLRGTHAQLLVGAEYRTAGEIAEADLGEVLAAILRFATTNQGERVLRSNPPPEREKIENWIGFAKQADMSRAA